MRPLHIELLKMQRWVIDQGLRLLVIFEGRDASGKGGAIKRVTKHLNPRHCSVVALAKPTASERTQWYFQRYVQHLPAAGQIVLFDRSWYNRAGIERVMGFCTAEEVERFLQDAPQLERMLAGSSIRLVKLYFAVDQAEQKRRVDKRRTNPLKRWKLTPLDDEALRRWDEYTAAEDEMFARTSIPEAPWVRVDANDRRAARVNVVRYLLQQLAYPDKSHELLDVDPAIVRLVPTVGGRP